MQHTSVVEYLAPHAHEQGKADTEVGACQL